MVRTVSRAEINQRSFESATDQALNIALTRDGSAVSVAYDDAGNTFVVGANAQAALDSTDAALIGKQPADAQLTSIAALSYAGNALKVIRVNAGETDFELATVSGGGVSDGDKGDITVTAAGATWTIDAGAVTTAKLGGDITAAGKALLDDADAAAQRTTLGLGTAATTASGDYAPISHVGAGGAAHANAAAAGAAGFMTGADKTKLDGVATGATANATDAFLLARANHTGTQSIATILAAATARLFGRVTGGGGVGEELTGTQATTLLDVFTSVLKGLVPASGGGTANFLRADGTWAAPGGGADPWTYIKLGSDFVTSSATAVNVTGMEFTPLLSRTYEVEAVLFTRTATTTVGPRPGVAWPTGLTDGVASISQTSSATANVFANGNIAASVLAPVGGLPNTTQSYPAILSAVFVAGASPSGTFRIQLASETAATNVTVKAGSYLKYRSI